MTHSVPAPSVSTVLGMRGKLSPFHIELRKNQRSLLVACRERERGWPMTEKDKTHYCVSNPPMSGCIPFEQYAGIRNNRVVSTYFGSMILCT